MFVSKAFTFQKIGVICTVGGVKAEGSGGGQPIYCLEHDPNPLSERIRFMNEGETELRTITYEELLALLASDEYLTSIFHG